MTDSHPIGPRLGDSLDQRLAVRYQEAAADLRRAMAPFQRELDDQSAEFLARLRGSGALSDEDWQLILGKIPSALQFLAEPNATAIRDEHGRLLIDPDADPRNANWIRLASAARKAQHHLPLWAAMWLWQVGHEQGASFWNQVARTAQQMQFPPYEPEST